MDPLGTAGAHVKQLLAHALREVLDGPLSNAILKVRIYAKKDELLSCMVACLLEGVVVKLPIVAVVVKDFHSMFSRILLKGKLGGECFG